jgi:hypothetical protein
MGARSPEGTTFIERLTLALTRLGFSEVFVDTQEITVGDFFEGRIHRAISRCDLFIPLIGRDWIRILEEKARLPDPDILERELAAALNLERDVVPLLVDGADMPRSADLPEGIQQLADIDAKTVASDASVEALVEVMRAPAQSAAQVRRLGPWWTRGYTLFAVFVWLLCGVLPNWVGLNEFGYNAWVGLATGWAGFFIWPFFFMPFIMLALHRPFQVILEATINADGWSDALKYASPIIIGLAFGALMTASEVSAPQVPWSIHPKLAEHCTGPEDRALKAAASQEPGDHYDRDRHTLASYGAGAEIWQLYGDEFWMKDKCWPNVFYYLTVPSRNELANDAYQTERGTVQRAFHKMIGKDSKEFKGTEAPYSYVFYVYMIGFYVWITLFATAVLMAGIYTAISIRRPRDGRVLRVPNEDAFLCLMFGCIAALVWVPFRMVTNSIKLSYYCVDGTKCAPIWEFYLKDGSLALAFVAGYVALAVGMLWNHKRLMLGVIGTTAVSSFCGLALTVFLFHKKIAELADFWQFWLAVSLLISLVLILLWYQYDPAIVRFKDFQEIVRARRKGDRGGGRR